MSTRTKNIRLMVNDDELEALDGWLVANGLARYPRSSAFRLFQLMVLSSGDKPTKEQIQQAAVVKLEKGERSSR